jgi:hypothetical protein
MGYTLPSMGVLKGLALIHLAIPVGLIALWLITGGIWLILAGALTAVTWGLGQVGVGEHNVVVVLGTLAVAFFLYVGAVAVSHDLKRW